ncbi:peptidyl-tRNA hydrolase [Vibrio sp. D431a]|uniref:peptidyl-tRNA hydrolase n=1 Tax=Vibrio sp. D431a TaxID=2837388 RepID=UPI0025522134|nr:peptidyl-tRNA hydrolase [Vibrio sp. D431a]MDK9790158.1 hypothetical protein [Vibrio sp. D431a]
MNSSECSATQVSIYVANDIGMGLGKVIAQAAHAYTKAYLDRCQVVESSDDYVLLKATDVLNKELNSKGFTIPKLVFCPADFLPEEDEVVSCIVDSGRTVFGEPTKTCSVSTTKLGTRVDEGERLRFNVGSIPYKQAFFINRKAVAEAEFDEHDVITTMAYLSASFVFGDYDYETGELKILKSSPLYIWLTSAFGKTVVGTKKPTKFSALIEQLDSDGVTNSVAVSNGQVWGVCTDVLPSDLIHKYTKFKTFNLLESIK